ncbi:hypothetical protein GSI_06802 [Ganoderma sinense ZZ0214-1]|uniref:Uncharacterized protein n=1 Tax=Ganoderma sinense ZZ0214-1 TaxID=1077348 RepID=A0A2G8SEG7_9APHY|nr:hypothetical protein GSI_06802 [Ganoderma sinense ZZ0214-1]
MLKVLVHHHGAPANAPFHSTSLLHLLLQLLSQPLLLSFLFVVFAAISIPPVAAAEGIIQSPKDGLSVIDSPAPNSVLHVGSNMTIAIDVSASNSGTFSYRSLEVYLVSATTGKNFTISNGTQLLTQEPASTVKHIDWPVATCLQTGEYNLTVYEASTLTSNDTSYFAIIPVPVEVQNNDVPDNDCASTLNVLQVQPQASDPPPVTLIPGRIPSNSSTVLSGTATNTATATATSPPAGGQVITVTAGDSDITIPLTDLPGTIVVEPSGGAPPTPTSADITSGFTTIFKTVAPTATETLTEIISQPITVTFEETFVSTVTGPGQTEELTVTYGWQPFDFVSA